MAYQIVDPASMTAGRGQHPAASPSVSAGARNSTVSTPGKVTYDGHPLCICAREGGDEVLCHNASEFGGVGLALTPGGEAAD